MLNRCLDDAIAGAVTEYGRARPQSRIDRPGASARGSFAHELPNLMNTAMMAFEVLKTGNVGGGGSTGAVLQRSLMASHTLISRLLAEVRLTQGMQNREQLLASDSSKKSQRLRQTDCGARRRRRGDRGRRQVLDAVIANLLQNDFKFTRPQTTVVLRVGASTERLLIEIQDKCGGLPSENVNEPFRPFEQHSGDRTGVGLGLAFSRWGAEAPDGRVYVHDLPDQGCVFTVDLPRVLVPAAAAV
jgi:signal transduction histidine kinase